MESSFLTPYQLACRWHMSAKTLAQKRWNGQGPHFSKVGGRVLYAIEDIEDYEKLRRCHSTSEYPTLSKLSNALNNGQERSVKQPLFPNKKG